MKEMLIAFITAILCVLIMVGCIGAIYLNLTKGRKREDTGTKS